MFKTEVQSAVQIHYDKLVELGYNVISVFLYSIKLEVNINE